MSKKIRLLPLFSLLMPMFSYAHGGHDISGTASGFFSGFLHPFYGADHMIAMVAVGLWGHF
nr:HupE/UreJ family protein [Vibrio variabilis]